MYSTCTRPRSGLGLNELLGSNPITTCATLKNCSSVQWFLWSRSSVQAHNQHIEQLRTERWIGASPVQAEGQGRNLQQRLPACLHANCCCCARGIAFWVA